jgi:hypothetical protein
MIPLGQHGSPAQVFEEQHYPIRYWSRRWGFSEKTVREWFRDEYGPGILRQPNVGPPLEARLYNDHDLAERCGTRLRETYDAGGNPLILRMLR